MSLGEGPATMPRPVRQEVRAEGGYAYGVIGADLHVFADSGPIYQVTEHRLEQPPEDREWLLAQPSRLLNARFRIVDFTGRDQELEHLESWRDGRGRRLAARWLHAPGGAGKSRLAAEFGLRSRAAGWKVVTVVHGRGTILPPAESVDLRVDGVRGVLLVVDYADRWPLSHLSWLFSNALLHHDVPTRLLLLGRSASPWAPVRSELDNLHVACDQTVLPPVPGGTTTDQRERMFAVARDCFADRYGVRDPSRIGPAGMLHEPEFDLILALHMAALVAVDAHVHEVSMPRSMAGLSTYLLDRERRHWTKLYENRVAGLPFHTPPEVMARAAFIATLIGSTTRPKGKAVLHRLDLETHPDRVLDDHARCYPAADANSVLEPLYPDRLAEDFVALSLPGHDVPEHPSDPSASSIVKVLTTREPDGQRPAHIARTLTVLASAAARNRWTHVAPHLDTILMDDPGLALAAGSATLMAVADAPDVDIATLEAIEGMFPERRDIDLDLGIATVARRIAAHRLARVQSAEQHGRILDDLAFRLRDAGLRAEALATRQAAIPAWRHLARADPDAYEGVLARALHTLATQLSEAGMNAEAIQTAEEALSLLRRLAAADPEVYGLDVAMALGNFGSHLAWHGRTAEALASTEESVRLLRKAASDTVVDAHHHLAISLDTLGNRLDAAGRPGEALEATQEAVAIYRQMMESNPAAYQAEIATALSNLSNRLQTARRFSEALTIADEAVAVGRRLAAANPRAFEPILAAALINQSGAQFYVGRHAMALAGTREAVEIHERLLAEEPGVHDARLAACLGSLGMLLTGPEAVEVSRRAVSIYRNLAAANPRGFEASLANALVTLAKHLTGPEHSAERIEICEEIVAIYRRLNAANPGGFEANLANALAVSARQHHSDDHQVQALEDASEAVSICRRLASDGSAESASIIESGFAWCLAHLAVSLPGEEGLAAAEQAVTMYRRLSAGAAVTFRSDLGRALLVLGGHLAAIAREPDAVGVFEEAVAICRDPGSGDFEGRLYMLAFALNSLGVLLTQTDQAAKGLQAAEEAVLLYRSVNPKTTALAQALNNLASALHAVGRGAEALNAALESVALYREVESVTKADLASALGTLAQLLHQAGRDPEALQIAREAVTHYRGLATENPNRFRPALVEALNLLGISLEALGLRDEHLTVAQEIADAWRPLAAMDPGTFEPRLAMALSQLATLLGEADRRAEALAPIRESVTILRRLADDDSATFEEPLAVALINMGSYLWHTGDFDSALEVTEVTVAAYRRLAAENNAHEKELALSLNNLGAYLAETGREDEALTPIREALTLYERHRDDTSLTDSKALASMLENFARRLHHAGEKEEELAAREQVVTTCRVLASADPSRHEAVLLTALTELAQLKAELNRWTEAAEITEESVAIQRRLYPETVEMAMALLSRGGYLMEAARRPEALALIKEAIAILRTILARGAPTPEALFDSALEMLLSLLQEQQNWPEALTCAEQLADVRRRNVQPDSIESQQKLTVALNALDTSLAKLGREPEAMAIATEALSIYRQLANADPQNFDQSLAASLYLLSLRYADAGLALDALTLMEESVEIFQRLPASTFAPYAAEALTKIDSFLMTLHWLREAHNPAGKAVDAYRRLASTDPARFTPDLAESLVNHGLRLSYISRFDEAINAVNEGTELIARLTQATGESDFPHYARALYAYAWILHLADRDHKKALEQATACLAIAGTLHAQNPQTYQALLSAAEEIHAAILNRLDKAGTVEELEFRSSPSSGGPGCLHLEDFRHGGG